MSERRTERDRDDRGGVAVLTAAVVMVLMISAAFAVDLGKQRVVRADMQALADTVALDAARLLDGRPAGRVRSPLPSDGQPSLQAAVDASVARNTSSMGDVVRVVPTLVKLATDANGAVVPLREDGALVPVLDNEVPDAVLVEAEGQVDFGFARVIGVESGGASRSAIADARPVACLSVGSYAAGVNSSQSQLLDTVLGDLLGSDVDLTLVGYQGLADADLSLVRLLDELALVDIDTLTVADVEQALVTDLSVAQLVDAAAVLLSGEDEEVQLALSGLSVGVDEAVDLGLLDDVTLGEVLGITQGGEAALSASVNALDLLVTGVQVANGEYAVDVPNLSITSSDLPGGLGALLPSVDSSGSVHVLPRAKQGCGPVGTQVRTAAVDIDQLGLTVDVNGGVVGGLLAGNPLAGVSIEPLAVTVDVAAAESTATLRDIKCGDTTSAAEAEGIDVSVASTAASTTVTLDPIALQANVLGIPDFSAVSIDLSLSLRGPLATVPPSAGPVQQFRTPPTSYDAPMKFGSGTVVTALVGSNLSLRVDGEISILGYPAINVTDGAADLSGFGFITRALLNPVVTAVLTLATTGLVPAVVAGVVNPAIALVNFIVGDVLDDVLGLTVAGADVYAVPRPACNSVALVG